jgi:hypothetical protein
MYMGRSVINIISNATQCTVYFSCFHVLLDFISYFNLVDYTCSLYLMCGTRCQFMCSTLCYVMLFTLESYQHVINQCLFRSQGEPLATTSMSVYTDRRMRRSFAHDLARCIVYVSLMISLDVLFMFPS